MRGFTLIELSIVLVIIGLIVGGVLVGRDLISAAAVRAQIAQVEKYQSAVNTFRVKYNYLPGDIPNPAAQQFGLAVRGPYDGQGDGNGLIVGNYDNLLTYNCTAFPCPFQGEQAMFWVDLSAAKLIEASFSLATPTAIINSTVSGSVIARYIPVSKISEVSYVYVWNGGWQLYASSNDFNNYFAISGVTGTDNANFSGAAAEVPGLTVAQAYNIDKKSDDGLPQYGRVLAMTAYGGWTTGGTPNLVGGLRVMSANGASNSGAPVGAGSGVATPQSDTTCYDNGNVSSAVENYSITRNNGTGLNCSLSIRFQ